MRTDTQLKAEVLRELQHHIGEIATGINLSVSNAVVTLQGVVRYCAEKLAAEQVVRGVEGVLDVVEAIEVRLALPAHGFLALVAGENRPMGQDRQLRSEATPQEEEVEP